MLALTRGLLRQHRAPQSGRALHVCKSIAEMRAYRRSTNAHSTLGFVPTMGALHSGHVSLAIAARKECDLVAGSIFVNPTQFGVGEDLDKYPRTLQSDLAMLADAGMDVVFVPESRDEMYAPNPLCHVEPAPFSRIMEGVARPDFFRGVATIVCKLFNVVQPTHAYFGQKDISQCILVQRLVQDLNMPVCVRVCETMRAEDGLALSSRNVYLSASERAVAGVLYKALQAGKALCEGRSEVSRAAVVSTCEEILRAEPLLSRIEYVSLASPTDMEELVSFSHAIGDGAVLSAAIRLGSVRLIDNVLVGSAPQHIYGNR